MPIKDKRKSRMGKYRRVYPYKCNDCKRRRMAFNYDRVRTGICLKCEKRRAIENQQSLFTSELTASV